MYINPVVSGKRTLGSISCNTTTSRSLRPIPSQLSALGVTPGLRTLHEAIAPHWSSSYPEYLSPDQDQEEQRRVVWSRLHNHRVNLANRLISTRDKYLAARRALNPRTTQAESSHDPLYRDMYDNQHKFTLYNDSFLFRVYERKPWLKLALSQAGWCSAMYYGSGLAPEPGTP